MRYSRNVERDAYLEVFGKAVDGVIKAFDKVVDRIDAIVEVADDVINQAQEGSGCLRFHVVEVGDGLVLEGDNTVDNLSPTVLEPPADTDE